LRTGILFGLLAAAAGYTLLGLSKTLLLACLWTIVAHMGGAVVWVFSTTLLQLTTEDRFRGRVFAAELGFPQRGVPLLGWPGGKVRNAAGFPQMTDLGQPMPGAAAHSTDAAVNQPSPAKNTRRRPQRSLSEPASRISEARVSV